MVDFFAPFAKLFVDLVLIPVPLLNHKNQINRLQVIKIIQKKKDEQSSIENPATTDSVQDTGNEERNQSTHNDHSILNDVEYTRETQSNEEVEVNDLIFVLLHSYDIF